jgi:hypothetical protein
MHNLAKKYKRLVESYIGVVSHRAVYFGADNEDKACVAGGSLTLFTKALWLRDRLFPLSPDK